jgi:hypothetical protein
MKELLFLFLFVVLAGTQTFARFIVHTYYMRQEPKGSHHIFTVITYDDGKGEIFVTAGEVQVGDCPPKFITEDFCDITLERAFEMEEVNSSFKAYCATKGIDTSQLVSSTDIAVLCNPEMDQFFVSRKQIALIDQITVLDGSGNVKMTLSPSQSALSECFSMQELGPGIYVVIVSKNGNQLKSAQIIKN